MFAKVTRNGHIYDAGTPSDMVEHFAPEYDDPEMFKMALHELTDNKEFEFVANNSVFRIVLTTDRTFRP